MDLRLFQQNRPLAVVPIVLANVRLRAADSIDQRNTF